MDKIQTLVVELVGYPGSKIAVHAIGNVELRPGVGSPRISDNSLEYRLLQEPVSFIGALIIYRQILLLVVARKSNILYAVEVRCH